MLRELFLNFSPHILGSLYFKLGLNLLPESEEPIDPDGVKRIGILATAGIGNVIMLTPMIRSLRRGISNSRIILVVASEGAKEALEGSEFVDEVIVLNSKGCFKALRDEWLDLTVDATHRGFMGAKLAFRIGAMQRLGFRYDHGDKSDTGFLYTHSIKLDESKHEVEQGLDLIRPLGLFLVRELYFHITDDDRKAGEKLLQDEGIKEGDLLIGIHAGMCEDDPKGRCWPIDRYAQLCQIFIKDYGAKPILIGDERDIPTAQKIADIMKEKPFILAGKTTLRQTGAILEKCWLFIGNDGVPMHISTAVKTPVVAIFGPTNSARYGPYGSENIVVKSDLPCIPCHDPRAPGIKCDREMECMRAVSVDMVMEAVKMIIRR